jgi:hypothetical protein
MTKHAYRTQTRQPDWAYATYLLTYNSPAVIIHV